MYLEYLNQLIAKRHAQGKPPAELHDNCRSKRRHEPAIVATTDELALDRAPLQSSHRWQCHQVSDGGQPRAMAWRALLSKSTANPTAAIAPRIAGIIQMFW